MGITELPRELQLEIVNCLLLPSANFPSALGIRSSLSLSRTSKLFRHLVSEGFSKDLALLCDTYCLAELNFYPVSPGAILKIICDLFVKRIESASDISLVLELGLEDSPYYHYICMRRRSMENFRKNVEICSRNGSHWSDIKNTWHKSEKCNYFDGKFVSSREIRFRCNLEDPAYLITLPKMTSLTAPMRLSKLTYFPGVFNCPLLTRISLHKCEIKELGQIYLAFPHLEELALPHNEITHIHSKSLPKTLKMLDLSWNPIRRPVIERLNNLESLWLDGCQLESVRRVRHLRALKLFSMVFQVTSGMSSFKLGSGIDWDEVEVEFGTLRHFPCMKCCHSSLC